MNRLILIGNGFDLAHGLKTSYKDFIFWYLDTCFNNAGIYENTPYEDEYIYVRVQDHYRLMKLLQVPTANLEERIKEELEENPALEQGEEGHEDEYTDELKDEFDSVISVIDNPDLKVLKTFTDVLICPLYFTLPFVVFCL